MATQMYLNLPVKDLKKSNAFFINLGFKFNVQFSNENATSVIVSESIYVMLLNETMFGSFTKKEIANAHKTTEMLIGISVDSREKVNQLVDAAIKAGGTTYSEPQDHGWMYQRSFADLDGHQWEFFHMDIAAMPKP